MFLSASHELEKHYIWYELDGSFDINEKLNLSFFFQC